MAKILYFLVTFLESGLALFGVRAPFAQPPYRVVAALGQGVEIRAYAPRVAVETPMAADDGEAFSRLFRYITGANAPASLIAMTTPVEMRGGPSGGGDARGLMRFFLPASQAGHPPQPRGPRVRIVTLPAQTVAVLRFSGSLNETSVARHEDILRAVLAAAGRSGKGLAYVMGYDPPFTIPFFRRNEVAMDLSG